MKKKEAQRLEKYLKKLSKATNETHYDARVKSFLVEMIFLLIYETFKDVRLVGPPSSIGKFGGDTDNWMWPRHTGVFALYRVYYARTEPGRIFFRNIAYTQNTISIQLGVWKMAILL